jgi:hypothetical protein
MADLPELPKHILRLQALRWKDLIEKWGFNGGHLDWHQSPQRREAALPSVSLLPRPPGSAAPYYGKQGEEVSYEEWVRIRKESRISSRNHPLIVDKIGTAETIAAAKERFAGIVGDYFTIWAAENKRDSDEFPQWLERLQNSVVSDVGDLWRKDEWHIAWFDRVCRKKVDDSLGSLAKEWALKARKLEIERLESLKRPVISRFDPGTPNLGSQSYQDAFAKFKKSHLEGLGTKQPVPALPQATTARCDHGNESARHLDATEQASPAGTGAFVPPTDPINSDNAQNPVGAPQWFVYTRLGQYGYGESSWFTQKDFATANEANAFLDGPSHEWPDSATRLHNGWLGPVKALAVCDGGPSFKGPWLREAVRVSNSDKNETFAQIFDNEWETSATDAIPYVMEQMESEGLLPKSDDPWGPPVLSKEQHRQVQRRAAQHKLPAIECALDKKWNFFEIELSARRRLGHLNPDEATGYERRLFAVALDLEDTLRAQHARLTAPDVCHFWTSLQVWVHLAGFCRKTLWRGRSDAQEIEAARLRFSTILGSYAHTVRAATQSEQTRREDASLGEPAQPTSASTDIPIGETINPGAPLTDVGSEGVRIGSTPLSAESIVPSVQGTQEKPPLLKVDVIKAWMNDEGWTNETLAIKLHTTERTISSIRNNGEYHGLGAVTKLANLMGRDIADLYLP